MRPMRKSNRQIDLTETFEILKKCTYGVLSTVDTENQPYGVPLSYALSEDLKSIYFHCAQVGHKLDNLSANDKACFTVIGDTKVLPAEFSTDYESAVVFGNTRLLEDEEKRVALMEIVKKYSPDFIGEGNEYIARAADHTTVFKLEIGHVTGKSRK